MRCLRVTARYCAGQTRMYIFLYPYMGIVYTHVTMYVHNVKVTAQVRRVYTFSDAHIWLLLLYTHVTMYIHNVRVTARVIYSTCIRLRISFPYMGTV